MPGRLYFARDAEFLLQNADCFAPVSTAHVLGYILNCRMMGVVAAAEACAILEVPPTSSSSTGCILPAAPCPERRAELSLGHQGVLQMHEDR